MWNCVPSALWRCKIHIFLWILIFFQALCIKPVIVFLPLSVLRSSAELAKTIDSTQVLTHLMLQLPLPVCVTNPPHWVRQRFTFEYHILKGNFDLWKWSVLRINAISQVLGCVFTKFSSSEKKYEKREGENPADISLVPLLAYLM